MGPLSADVGSLVVPSVDIGRVSSVRKGGFKGPPPKTFLVDRVFISGFSIARFVSSALFVLLNS